MLWHKIQATPQIDKGWNLSNAAFVGGGGFLSITENCNGMFFKPDGTSVYVTSDKDTTNSVFQYDLSVAWSLSSGSFNQSFNVGFQDTAPHDLSFKSDGTKMYLVGDATNTVYEYNLSTAWDISTATLNQSFSVSSQQPNPRSIGFKTDGLKMFVSGEENKISEYALSTAWDISTASHTTTFTIPFIFSPLVVTAAEGFFFKPDGTRLYTFDQGDVIGEWNLGTAWSVSSITFSRGYDVNGVVEDGRGISLKQDGTKLYLLGEGENSLFEFNLSSAWNVTTAAFVYPAQDYFDVSGVVSSFARSLFIKPDGANMYVLGGSADLHQYSLGTAWDIDTASFVKSQSFSSRGAFDPFFKTDGTKLYFLNNSNDVDEYNLGTAWDIATASYSQSFDPSPQSSGPSDIYISDDGLNLFISDAGSDKVLKYVLGTAWDISTASYSQQYDTGENFLVGLSFKPDGRKMYLYYDDFTNIKEYRLSSPWNLSTVSGPTFEFAASAQEFDMGALVFKVDDGLKMYITGDQSNAVWAFSLEEGA